MANDCPECFHVWNLCKINGNIRSISYFSRKVSIEIPLEILLILRAVVSLLFLMTYLKTTRLLEGSLYFIFDLPMINFWSFTFWAWWIHDRAVLIINRKLTSSKQIVRRHEAWYSYFSSNVFEPKFAVYSNSEAEGLLDLI